MPGGPRRGSALLLSPQAAAPGMSSACCRYVVARTVAATIVAASCIGGSIKTSGLLAKAFHNRPALWTSRRKIRAPERAIPSLNSVARRFRHLPCPVFTMPGTYRLRRHRSLAGSARQACSQPCGLSIPAAITSYECGHVVNVGARDDCGRARPFRMNADAPENCDCGRERLSARRGGCRRADISADRPDRRPPASRNADADRSIVRSSRCGRRSGRRAPIARP